MKPIRITIHDSRQLDSIEKKLDSIEREIKVLNQNLKTTGAKMATDLSALATEISEMQDTVSSASALIEAIVNELANAGGNQEEVDALVEQLRGAQDQLAQAVANVPHADNTLPGDL